MSDLQIHTPTKVIKPEDFTADDLRHLGKDSFPMWTLTSGVKVDGNEFDFNLHRYLLPIYSCTDKVIVWQKAAQLGATVYMFLRLVWWLQNHQGRKAALYLPTKELAENMSKDRLTPLMRSVDTLKSYLDEEDKLTLKKIGESSLYLMHLEGKSAKDSIPLDFIAFDEVRLVNPKDIDQARERISHSLHKYEVYMSTSGSPGTDINARYERGTQHVWRSACNCSEGTDLARTFPNCVVNDHKRGLYLRCPKCLYTIKNPQNGRYVPMNPSADYVSFNVSQLASRFITLKDIWSTYETTTNMEEFYNSKLGLPYVDEANRGVTMSDLEQCINTDLTWGKPTEGEHCAMGVDQGAGYNMVVIMSWKDGKRRLRHVEIIESNNPDYYKDGGPVSPFVRLEELMVEYNVRLCLVDAMPNTNEAIAFAHKFPRKVFLAWYIRHQKDSVIWMDKNKTQITIAKAGPAMKLRQKATLSRYVSLSNMLGFWQDGSTIMPNPDALVQMCRAEKTNQLHPESPARRLMEHLCLLIRRATVVDEETGETKYDWIYTSQDPHLAHATNYCVTALERMGRGFTFGFA